METTEMKRVMMTETGELINEKKYRTITLSFSHFESGEYQSKKDYNYYEQVCILHALIQYGHFTRGFTQLSVVEYELFDMTPVMFTLYGEEFVNSVNEILEKQSLDSSVVGVLVSDQDYEESTM